MKEATPYLIKPLCLSEPNDRSRSDGKETDTMMLPRVDLIRVKIHYYSDDQHHAPSYSSEIASPQLNS